MMLKLKAIIRVWLRNLLGIRENETISDGIQRHKYKIIKIWYRRKISKLDIEQILKNIGINEGDTLIVHCSWRGCFSLNCTPNDLIEILRGILQKTGTLLMPCNGAKTDSLDVKNTPSNVGILSEIFRKNTKFRSCFTMGTMCGEGKNAYNILSNHKNSQYAFDEKSPYYIATNDYNAKVLLLGMGVHPHKITVFHCATYASKEKNNYLSNVYTKKMIGKLVDENGKEHKIHFIDRRDGCQNDKKKFKRLFMQVPKENIKVNGLTITLFEAKKAFEIAKEYSSNGGILYKG